jgi:hypothetical protein
MPSEWTAGFLAMIDQAEGHSSALNELIELDSLTARSECTFSRYLSPEMSRQAPGVLRRFLGTVKLPVPVAEAEHEPVTFESMISKRAKHTNAPNKGLGAF